MNIQIFKLIKINVAREASQDLSNHTLFMATIMKIADKEHFDHC